MKRFLTMILVMMALVPSTLCVAQNTEVHQVLATPLSNSEVKVEWSWSEIVPQSVVIDFETGDFSQGNFINDDEYPWEITQDAYEGNYAAKSSNEGVDGDEHFLTLEVDVPYDAIMSFYHKVSSEWSYDGGVFYIDGQSRASMTGTDKDWEYVEVAVSAGKHTYAWGYFKDESDFDGEDTYWVDNIVPFAPREEITEGWLHYDDGVFANGAGMGYEGGDNYWAVSFPDMSAYAGQTLTKVATMIYQGSNVTASVCLGGTDAPGTVMATKSFTATPEQVVEVELNTPVAIDGTQPLWIVMYCNDGRYPAAASQYCGDPNSSWFGSNDEWAPVSDWGLSPMSWIIRGYVEDANGRTVAISQGDLAPMAATADKVMAFTPEKKMIVGTPARTPRSEGYTYNLYKQNVFTNGEAELVAEGLTDTVYVDNTWATDEVGIYQWGVAVVTGGNDPENPVGNIVWSNTIDKDMFTMVDVTVELNTDDNAKGTEVTLANVNEPEYVYETVLDATGTYTWNEIRRGTYEFTVYKKGYESSATAEVVEILDETTLTCTLTEIISAANNLYVSPTGWAKWEGEKVITKGDEFIFGFEDGTMDGWVTYDVDGDDFTWKHVWDFWGEDYGYNSNASILSASYTNELGPLFPDNYIVTEEKYLIGGASQLTFMVSPFDDNYPNEYYGVAVSTTGNTPEDLEMIWEETFMPGKGTPRNADATRAQNITREGNWYLRTVDLSAFEGQEIYIALRHFNCTDQYIFFIDDITLTNATKSSRAIESYTVLLNGVEEATVTDLHYRHEDVTAGETYTTTVIANFASGSSDPVEYTWTAVACDEYEGVSDLDIKYSDGNAMLTWTIPAEALGVLVYRDGKLLTEEILYAESYSDPLTAAGTFNYCVEAVYEDYATSCLQCEEFEYDGVSVKENDANAMRIYPNPVKDNLTITAEAMTRITITNTLGQVMYDEEVVSDNQEINVSQYKAGVYVVRIATETGVIVERVVVNN